MEIIINHMNRSLNIIKPRAKDSKGTRRQTAENSAKTKLSQTSENQSSNSHMVGDTTTFTVSPWRTVLTTANSWYSKYCSFNQSDNKILFCRFSETVNHDAERSIHMSYSLLPTVANLALIRHMKLKNINLPNADAQTRNKGWEAEFFPWSFVYYAIPVHRTHILLT